MQDVVLACGVLSMQILHLAAKSMRTVPTYSFRAGGCRILVYDVFCCFNAELSVDPFRGVCKGCELE